jgi:hypothetical protein
MLIYAHPSVSFLIILLKYNCMNSVVPWQFKGFQSLALSVLVLKLYKKTPNLLTEGLCILPTVKLYKLFSRLRTESFEDFYDF